MSDEFDPIAKVEPLEENFTEMAQGTNESRFTEKQDDEAEEIPSPEVVEDTPKKKKYTDIYSNKGKVLNRSRILSVILFIFIFFILFFLFILPIFKKEKKEQVSLDKAGKTYIPEVISMWEKDTKTPNTSTTAYQTQVFDDDISDEELDAIIAEIPISDEAQVNTSTSSSTSSATSTRPITNRNPVQKQVTRMAWNSNSDTVNVQQNKSNNQSYNPYAEFGLPSKEEYVNKVNSMYTQNSTDNIQTNKEKFFSENTSSSGNYQWNSDYSLFKGSIIQAVLETGINTNVPGIIIARITKNVYSSLDGKYLLIPAGTRVFATYNSSLSIAQKRVQISWNTLIRPDGFEMDLGNFSGADLKGYSGITGFVDDNFFEYVKAMGIISLFSILNGELDNSLQQLNSNSYTDQLVSENRTVINQLSSKMINRALDIQPTIIIMQGTVVNILTNKTLNFPPVLSYPVTEKYQR